MVSFERNGIEWYSKIYHLSDTLEDGTRRQFGNLANRGVPLLD